MHNLVHSKASEYMTNNNPSQVPGASKILRERTIQLWIDRPDIPEKLFEGYRKLQLHNPTKLELNLFYYLEELDVSYEKYKMVKPKFIVDAIVNNRIVIEADGDWWHGHPRFNPLNERQVKQQKRDKSKESYLSKCGYTVYRIWESDMSFDAVKSILIQEGIVPIS